MAKVQSFSAARIAPASGASLQVMRLFQGFLGCAMVVSAFGLWLLPMAYGAPDMSLLRLGLSLALLIGGMCSLVCARDTRR